MKKYYTEDDFKIVMGQVSSEISKVTGTPREEIYPFSELNRDIGMSISEFAQLSISLENRYKHDFSSLVEDPFPVSKRQIFHVAGEKQTVESLARFILEINPNAAEVGAEADKILPQKKAEHRLVFKVIDNQNTRQK